MNFPNEPYVAVTIGGEILSADVFRRLADAIEASGLDLVPLRIDTEKALLETIANGEPLRLEAEDGNLGWISDFERQVHILGLECVVAQKVLGGTTVRTWLEGRNRPTVVDLDNEGRVLVRAEMVMQFLSEGERHLTSYLEEASAIGRRAVGAISAMPEVIGEIQYDMTYDSSMADGP